MRNVTGSIRNMVNTVDCIRRSELDSRIKGFVLGKLHRLKNDINLIGISLTTCHDEMHQNFDQTTSNLRENFEQIKFQNIKLEVAKKLA